MKRTTLALAAALFACLAAPASARAGGGKVDVCHLDADAGTYHRINVPSHVAEGQPAPGDPVPGMEGYEFGPECELVAPTMCPTTGTLGDTLGSVWFYMWVDDVEFGYMGCVDTWPWFFNWGVQWDYFYGGAHLKFCLDAECSAPYECDVPVS